MISPLYDKSILLIMTGGIASYKCLDLIRRLKERGAKVRVIMTRGAQEFITPLAVSSLSHEAIYSDLFNVHDEMDVGHIRLSREADFILIAPATANFLAKIAHGLCDDLASVTIVASDKKTLIAPAMNSLMWAHEITGAHIKTLQEMGHIILEPTSGSMAEKGETGTGRMQEPLCLIKALERHARLNFEQSNYSCLLKGLKIIITAGPTREAIDPIRYLSNHSSGKQAYALAEAAYAMGGTVKLISGPTCLDISPNIERVHVTNAQEMYDEVHKALPADLVFCVAAVSDWQVDAPAPQKMKKGQDEHLMLRLKKTKDILRSLGHLKQNRPSLIVGFAAETENLIQNASQKLHSKKADLIVANDVKAHQPSMGGDNNKVCFLSHEGYEDKDILSKEAVSEHLLLKAYQMFQKKHEMLSS